jgi:hypothetical protein
MNLVIQMRDGSERHFDIQNGHLEFFYLAVDGVYTRREGLRLELSEISALEVNGHYVPKPQIPPRTEEFTQSRAAYFLGAENEKYGSKEDREKQMTLTIAKRPKGSK